MIRYAGHLSTFARRQDSMQTCAAISHCADKPADSTRHAACLPALYRHYTRKTADAQYKSGRSEGLTLCLGKYFTFFAGTKTCDASNCGKPADFLWQSRQKILDMYRAIVYTKNWLVYTNLKLK